MLILHLSKIKCRQRQFLHFERLSLPAGAGVLGYKRELCRSIVFRSPFRLEQSKISQWSFEIVEHALKELEAIPRFAKIVDLSVILAHCLLNRVC